MKQNIYLYLSSKLMEKKIFIKYKQEYSTLDNNTLKKISNMLIPRLIQIIICTSRRTTNLEGYFK